MLILVLIEINLKGMLVDLKQPSLSHSNNLLFNTGSPQKEHVFPLLSLVALSTSRPIIANSVCKHRTIVWHVSCHNRLSKALACAVLCFFLQIPSNISAVSAIAAKCVVLLVKSEAIDLVYICLGLFLLVLNSVAFETKVCSLSKILAREIHVSYSTSPFDTSTKEPFAIPKALKCGCSELQSRLDDFFGLKLILCKALFEIPNWDEAILVSCHE